MKLNSAILRFVLALLAIIGIGFLLLRPLHHLFTNLDELRIFVLQFHILAPIILVVLIALSVIVVPVPGQLVGAASGFLYGTLLGTIYSMAGLMLGSAAVFLLARRFGRPFVEFVVDKRTLNTYDEKISSPKGLYALFLIFLLPLLPDDAVCYIAGLTKIRFKTFMIVSALGRLPGFIVLNMFGAGVASENGIVPYVMVGVAMVVSLFIYFFREPMRCLIGKCMRQ
jgi:uncharacterized membrane protein YdjX (TVP38/TMEM64 family)